MLKTAGAATDWKAQQAARAFAAKQLQIAHPHLSPAEDNALGAAAKNIRLELKLAFPTVKFSVKSKRFSGGDDIRVAWIDGPTAEQVDPIIQRYSAGTFDGMTDSYNYARGAWTDAFGKSKFIFGNREHSDKAIGACIRTVFNRYAGNLEGIAVPPVTDYRMGRLYSVKVPGLNHDLQMLISIELQRRTWAIAAKVAA